jgi:hypothetical protein
MTPEKERDRTARRTVPTKSFIKETGTENVPSAQAGNLIPSNIGQQRPSPSKSQSGSGGLATVDITKLKDVTPQLGKMGLDSAILHKVKNPPKPGSPHYCGTARFSGDGKRYFVSLWLRALDGVPVFEIRWSPFQKGGQP